METSPDQPESSRTPSSPGPAAPRKESRERRRTRRKQPPRMVHTNFLVHLLFYDTRFRWATIAAVVVVIVMGLTLPKIWITSPKGYDPLVKVSGLDLLQAWSLRRSAVQAEATAQWAQSIPAWIAALANDPASEDSLRGLLRTLAGQPLPDRVWLGTGQREAANLLRLTRTNAADLELAARFHARYDQHEWIVARLGTPDAPATPVTTAALLRSLFALGHMEKFSAVWAAHGASVAKDPVTAIYHAAWQAGWGPAGEAPAGRAHLETALQDPALRALALSRLLRVHHKTMDLASYEQRLAQLTDLHEDTMKDHLLHWQLLEVVGRRSEAATLAKAYPGLPQTPADAELLLTTWARLGLGEAGADFARQQMAGFSHSPVVWVRLGQLLAEGKQWDELRVTAIKLRAIEPLKPILGDYSWFLQGVAEHGLGRRGPAEDAFIQFLKLPPKEPQIAFQSAVTLNRLGYPDPAAILLKSLEAVAGNDLAFWKQVQLTAYEGRQAEVLLAACEKVHQLAPEPVNASNFAAALLMMRERPADAVQLTLQVVSRAPQSRIARVNHALALVQNGRTEEGEQILRSVNTEQMSDSDRSLVAFVWFQCHRQAGRPAEARAAAAQIDVRHLFPPQVRWLEQAKAELPKA